MFPRMLCVFFPKRFIRTIDVHIKSYHHFFENLSLLQKVSVLYHTHRYSLVTMRIASGLHGCTFVTRRCSEIRCCNGTSGMWRIDHLWRIFFYIQKSYEYGSAIILVNKKFVLLQRQQKYQ